MGTFKRTPSAVSLQAAHHAASAIARQAAAPIRLEFMVDTDHHGAPPVARLLRGGRGGEVRLKLLLSMLWLGPRRPRHEMPFRSSFWAELLDLPDPSGAGARRISDAMSWLEAHGFIRTLRRPGYPPRVTLCDERGAGATYAHPPGRYIKLPAEFWTRRWIHDMSGAALALFLVILAELHLHGPRLWFWLAPRIARETYGLSADTWSKASAELAQLGLIQVGRAKLRGEHVDVLKRRNTYRLITPIAAENPLTWPGLATAIRATLETRPEPMADPQEDEVPIPTPASSV